METNSQQPTGQAPQAPQGQPQAAAPEKAANLNQAVERAADTAKTTPQPQQQEGQPEDWEWDGNPNTLPPQFAKYGKGIQRHFTKRSMADADIRKAGEEYQKFLQSEDWKQFQTYKQTLGQQPSPAPSQTIKQPLVSQAEYEDALLDSTGTKFGELVDKIAEQKIRALDEKVNNTHSQLQHEKNIQQWNASLSDFAELHPEAVEYHNMGLMEPIVRQEMQSGKHPSYESVLNAALARVEKSVQAIRQQEFNKAQGRVTEKKDAVVNTGTSVGEFSIVEVDKDDAFNKAFEFAAQNKKVKVRSKR